MVFTVDDCDRSKGTGAEAVHGFERKLLVGRGFAGCDFQLALYRLFHSHTSADVASGAQTYMHQMFTSRFEAERPVKRGDGVDSALRYLEEARDGRQILGRQPVCLLLDILQHRDERVLMETMPRDDWSLLLLASDYSG
jgi:hypothetical protein